MPRASALGLRILAVLFAASALSDLLQTVVALGNPGTQPRTLVVEHALAGLAGAAAAVGLWRGVRWAAAAIVAWGLLTAVLLATLPSVLSLAPEARPGLFAAAAAVLLLALLAAWYAQRRGGREAGG